MSATATLAALLDDAVTPLPTRRVTGSADPWADLRTRPWWSIDQAGRECLAAGEPLLWRSLLPADADAVQRPAGRHRGVSEQCYGLAGPGDPFCR